MQISNTISIMIFCIVEHALPISITIFGTVEHPFKTPFKQQQSFGDFVTASTGP